MFETGLSSALVFFAPRRMGKTEFLRKDILPLSEKKSWETFYFSFLDAGQNVQEEFTTALMQFAESIGIPSNKNNLFSRIRRVGAEAAGIKANIELGSVDNSSSEARRPATRSRDPEILLDTQAYCTEIDRTGSRGQAAGRRDLNCQHALDESKKNSADMKTLFAYLAAHGKIILLLDEVQALANQDKNQQFIASLRTSLDLYKDTIKVIFTGSSREGLRKMFSQSTAPFFHFGQNLPFPELNQDFTNHLSDAFNSVTKRTLDKDVLWVTFQEMDYVPQLARSLVERLALNPSQTITSAKEQLFSDMFNDRAYIELWGNSSNLEQILLKEISNGMTGLFNENNRTRFAKILGVQSLSVSSIQSALRVLQRKNLIGRMPERAGYFIEDPNFKSWLQQVA